MVLAVVNGSGECSRIATPSRLDDSRIIQQLGYQNAIPGRSVVQKAVANCNLILNPNLNIRICPSWVESPTPSPTPSATTILSHQNEQRDGIEWDSTTVLIGGYHDLTGRDTQNFASARLDVPVFVVTSGGLTDTEISFVPRGYKCIVVNSPGVNHIANLFHPAGENARLQTNIEFAMTLILLHEVGHIVNGDSGSFTQPFNLSDLKDSLNTVQNRELKADLFAVTQIKQAAGSGLVPDKGPMGMNLGIEINGVVFDMLAGQVEALRRNEFPSSTSYMEHGYSHPNIELRFLIMAYKYDPSPVLLVQLQEFLHSRAKRPAAIATE